MFKFSDLLIGVFLLLFAFSGSAAEAPYHFCVATQKMETFRAVVTFKSIDFGELAARQLLVNHLKPYFGDSLQLTAYDESCECFDNCPVLEVDPKSWKGKLDDDEVNFTGAAVETIDEWGYEVGQMFKNPGGTLQRVMGNLRQWISE